MPPQSTVDWAAVRRSYVAGEKPIKAIAKRHGVADSTLRDRASKEAWPRARRNAAPPATTSSSRSTPTGLATRRALLRRLIRAIAATVTRMETRMKTDAAEGSVLPTAADQERDSRLINSLIRNLAKVTELESDLHRAADGGPDGTKSRDARDLADEADRFRRDIAERLARLGQPRTD